jgi:predicted metal-dependent hydrolase
LEQSVKTVVWRGRRRRHGEAHEIIWAAAIDAHYHDLIARQQLVESTC